MRMDSSTSPVPGCRAFFVTTRRGFALVRLCGVKVAAQDLEVQFGSRFHDDFGGIFVASNERQMIIQNVLPYEIS